MGDKPDRAGLDELRIEREELEGGGRSRGWLWLLAGLVVAAGIVWGVTWLMRHRPVEVRMETVRASGQGASGDRTVLNASGYVVARREATVSSKVTGKVMDVLIEEGMEVEEGQVLARLDDSNLRMQLELMEAQEAAARSGLAETQVRLEEAERERGRVVKLAGQGVSSESEVDRVESEVRSLLARLERQSSEVVVTERRVAAMRQELDDTVIRAPFSGVAVSKNAQPGEMISPISAGGGFTRTGIGTIVDMSSLEIEVDVNESHLHRVEVGQRVDAALDAYPDWKIPCRVLAIIPTADRQKATVRVRIAFEALDRRILPQMGVRVAFLAAKKGDGEPGGVVVSRAALRREGDGYYTWLVQDGVVSRRDVTVELPEADPVVVLSGLRVGETVVVEGPPDLVEGRRVRERVR
jgi:RND family efflux transporter MFP subunit